jgi:hypothetical protein
VKAALIPRNISKHALTPIKALLKVIWKAPDSTIDDFEMPE